MSIKLYAHNYAASKAVISLLEQTGKAAVIHPTGTGKSYIAFNLAQTNPTARVCWLSPSEYIYKTQLENLKATDPSCEFENIQFYTYSKLILMSEEQLAEILPQFIILDEFHRCGAEKWGAGVGRLIAAYPQAKILGLSATNIRYLDNKRDMADELFDGNVASEMTLGEAIIRKILPAPQYITSVYSYQKELENYQRRVAAITERPVRDTATEYLEELRRSLECSSGLEEIFSKYIRDKSGKYIAFCASREHMREMSECAKKWFSQVDKAPNIYCVYSDNPQTSREFSDFKADKSEHLKLLFCINMLNEGIHISDIDGVILFRPTVSPIIYKQQIGRALSAGNCKTPQIFDIVNNFQNLNSISSLQDEMEIAARRYYQEENPQEIIQENFQIYDEVKDCRRLFDELQNSLCAGWEQHFLAAKEYREKFGNLKVPNRYKTSDGLSLGSWLVTQRRVRSGQILGNLTAEKIEKLDRIGMEWENKFETAWEQNFASAKEHFESYGNLDVPARYVLKNGVKLGAWIATQRQAHLSSLLSDEKSARLEEIGMEWSAIDAQWEKNYAAAVEYYVENGNLDVKASYKTKDGFALGTWVRNLRKARAKLNGCAQPTSEQIARLDSIGMVWGSSNDAKWQQNYLEARRYYMTVGNLDVPIGYKTLGGIALGRWIYNQRVARFRPEIIHSTINDERIAKLDQIGMDWKQDGKCSKPDKGQSTTSIGQEPWQPKGQIASW
ncbi:MAG: Helicase associated domain protein [Oscillospiraceae bacterium]